MALELHDFKLPGLVADSDLSDKQYNVVKIVSEGAVDVYDGSGTPIGVLQNAPEEGQTAEIAVSGLTKIALGAETSAGDELVAEDGGEAIPTGEAGTDEDDNPIIGVAYLDSDADTIGSAIIGLFGSLTEFTA